MTTLQSRPWKLGDPVSLRFDGPTHIYRLGFCVTCGVLLRECPVLHLGGAGSGNFGHGGRPGEVGGSSSGGGDSFQRGEGGLAGATERTSSADTSGGIDTGYFDKRGVLSSPKNDPGYHGGYTAEEHAAAHAAIAAVKGLKPPLQPFAAQDVTPEAHAKAAAMITADDKVPVDQVLDALGGNARAQFAEMMAKGKEAQPHMTAMVDSMADEVGAKRIAPKDVDPEQLGAIVMQGDPKGLDRGVKKAVGKYGGDARKIGDIVRSSVGVDHIDQLDDAIAAVHDAVKAAGGEIVTSEDKFAKPLPSGYRDLNLNVRMPNGVIGEVQVHLKSMLYAKEKLGGHTLYEAQRVISERGRTRPLDADELAEVRRLDSEMAKLYAGAWRYAGGT